MAEHDRYQYIEVKHNDRTVATAEVTTRGGSGGIARASFRAESGHVPPGHRASLVDAVLDLPEVRQSARLEAAFPLGDTELLHRLQERCENVRTRPAGGSALLDAGLPASTSTAGSSDSTSTSTSTADSSSLSGSSDTTTTTSSSSRRPAREPAAQPPSGLVTG